MFDDESATLVVFDRDLRTQIYNALDGGRAVHFLVLRVTDGGPGSTTGSDSMCPC